MNPKDIKSKVLQSLIEEMDGRIVDQLKSKSPKFAKVEVAAKDPEALEDGLDKAKEMLDEDSPMEGLKENLQPELNEDEDLERLMTLYKQLK